MKEEVAAEIKKLLETMKEMVNSSPLVQDVSWEGEATSEVRMLATHFAQSRQATEAVITADGGRLTMTSDLPKILNALERLTWLLDLSAEEASFVRDATGSPRDFHGLSIFADWLHDQQRHTDAGEIETLIPQDGDVLLIRWPETPENADEHYSRKAKEALDLLTKGLMELGRHTFGIGLPPGFNMECLSSNEMLQNGWVREEVALRAWREGALAALVTHVKKRTIAVSRTMARLDEVQPRSVPYEWLTTQPGVGASPPAPTPATPPE